MKSSKNILFNCSNLHHGGAVQVAASFIAEFLSANAQRKRTVKIYVSSVVHINLLSQGIDTSNFDFIEVLDVFSTQALRPSVLKRFQGFYSVFTIFGPFYLSRKIKNHVVGFAQPWILYPANEITQQSDLFTRIKYRVKFAIQWQFFKFSAARLVVELPHVKRRLVEFKNFPSDLIAVVPNCFSKIYIQPNKWQSLPECIPRDDGIVRLGYVSRAYAHKNLQILLEVARMLKQLTLQKFEFFVTLTDAEWQNFSDEFRDTVRNIGSLTVAQCPNFYQAMDGVVFTSVLECFSATPLEAMVMRKPLFASDRDFVRDVCASHATYVNPIDAQDIAKKIISWYVEMPVKQRFLALDAAHDHVMSLPTARDRALEYIRIIENC